MTISVSVDGLVVDLFAGGGGASTGLAWALGRDPDIAINHDAEALTLHAANHPRTRHLQNDITRVLPLEATGGRKVAILHASPDCTHFSKAKGGKPRSQHIRDLAWVVIRWAEDTRPTLITLENVEEFLTWGPLSHEGYPIKSQAGQTFRSWARCLRRLGYKVAWRLLRACDYGAPTTRKRLFVVARRDGGRIVWPRPTHGDPKSSEVQAGKLLPWRTAAECIDWGIRSQSIFNRKKPLAFNTQRRIAEGLRRYVFQAAEPFIVTNTSGHVPHGIKEPLSTVTTGNQQMLAVPFVLTYYGPKKEGDFRGRSLRAPLPTQTTENRFAVVAPVLSRQFGKSTGQSVDKPHPTITQCNHDALISAMLVGAEGLEQSGEPASVSVLLRTVMPRNTKALATACMVKYYGNEQGGVPVLMPLHTITSKNHMGLVTARIGGIDERAVQTRAWLRAWGVIGPDDDAIICHAGQACRIIDICMRMLTPRELYIAQGFPTDYKIDTPYNGKPLTKTAQIRMCGNSVPPQLVCHLVKANGPDTWASLNRHHRQRQEAAYV